MGQADIKGMLRALDAPRDAVDADVMIHAVLDAAVATIDSDSAVVTELGTAAPKASSWPPGFLTEQHRRTFETINCCEPWPLATHTRDGDGRPLRISDLLTPQEYRCSLMYEGLFAELEVHYQVAFSVPISHGRGLCVALQRTRRDFSDDEGDTLAALRRSLSADLRRGALVSADVWSDGTAAFAEPSSALTVRELEVLALVSRGLTDDQIGRRLGLSRRTVSKHLQHVYQKTGTSNRTQACASKRRPPSDTGGSAWSSSEPSDMPRRPPAA
jgi:DNA-binding CsgD family transcriptional regulator